MDAEGIGASFHDMDFVNHRRSVFLCLTPRFHVAAARQVLNGIKTEVVVIPYADRTFVVVTQLKKLGNLVSVTSNMPFCLSGSSCLLVECEDVLPSHVVMNTTIAILSTDSVCDRRIEGSKLDSRICRWFTRSRAALITQ